MTLILGVALSSGIYQQWVVSGAQSLADGLAGVVSGSTTASGLGSAGSGVYGVLDALEAQGSGVALTHMLAALHALPMAGYTEFIAACAMAALVALLLVALGGSIVLAKVLLTICLALGPLAIVCLAFPPAAPLFRGWWQRVLQNVLLMVLLTGLLGLVVRIYGTYLNALSANVGQTNVLVDCIELLILTGVLVLVVFYLPGLAAGLAGGAASFSMQPWALVFSQRAAPIAPSAYRPNQAQPSGYAMVVRSGLDDATSVWHVPRHFISSSPLWGPPRTNGVHGTPKGES
jgi:type IV secretion system protein VirB6